MSAVNSSFSPNGMNGDFLRGSNPTNVQAKYFIENVYIQVEFKFGNNLTNLVYRDKNLSVKCVHIMLVVKNKTAKCGKYLLTNTFYVHCFQSLGVLINLKCCY
jgi:hypothetical protein